MSIIDPQLKFSLRRKIREITEQFQPTVIYVTHDQYEAMSFAQELLVMKDGVVVQQGTPEQLFEAPASTYVGYFIGSPAMNFLSVERDRDQLTLAGRELAVAWAPDATCSQVGIRPEYVRIVQEPAANTFPATLREVRDHGPLRVLELDLGGQPVKVKVPREQGVPTGRAGAARAAAQQGVPYAQGRLATTSA